MKYGISPPAILFGLVDKQADRYAALPPLLRWWRRGTRGKGPDLNPLDCLAPGR